MQTDATQPPTAPHRASLLRAVRASQAQELALLSLRATSAERVDYTTYAVSLTDGVGSFEALCTVEWDGSDVWSLAVTSLRDDSMHETLPTLAQMRRWAVAHASEIESAVSDARREWTATVVDDV